MLGTFDDIVFEVSTQRIRTFDEFERTGQARWQNMDVIGDKPRPQFIGPGQDFITFVMRFYPGMGIEPEKEMQRLYDMRDKGKVSRLFLAGKPVGSKNARWYIEKISEETKFWNSKGELLGTEVEVQLAEYH